MTEPERSEATTAIRDKRQQILDGARAVFLDQGFDGASMNDVARVAGVSKGTLYVYFTNKESLFAAVVAAERAKTVWNLTVEAPADGDLAATLRRFGEQFVAYLASAWAVKTNRTVAGIAERMPQVGRDYWESGPGRMLTLMSRFLDAQVIAGRLDIVDTRLAASQLLDLCQSSLIKPMLIAAAPAPGNDEIARVVESAVTVFMRAYGAREAMVLRSAETSIGRSRTGD